MDVWTGIGGVVTLPEISFDPARKRSNGRPSDNPSIYMGGKAGDQEIDAGLSWEIIREPDGKVSAVGKAFRPFWRDSISKTWNSGPTRQEYYYYPGDTVAMSCVTTESGKLTLTFELLSRAEHDTLTSAPLSVFSTTFPARNFAPGALHQFKRVNAIDQAGNEGHDVQPTSSSVTSARWSEVYLLRGDAKLTMGPERFTDMRCPGPQYFHIKSVDQGGEFISIYGDPPQAITSAESLLHD